MGTLANRIDLIFYSFDNGLKQLYNSYLCKNTSLKFRKKCSFHKHSSSLQKVV